jgi:hypothetical protein
MRLFLKGPQFEYFPYDNFQAVPFICKLRADTMLKLAAPIRQIMADPTRRPEPLGHFGFLERGLVEMYHYTLVRMDMSKKINSVSNKGNYEDVERFLRQFEHWNGPEDGPIHPHPLFKRLYSEIKVAPNYFDIQLERMCPVCFKTEGAWACPRCAQRYCGEMHGGKCGCGE